ncbi:MAG: Aldo/keto reductase [Acidimicrobiaceae bacterium]|nr:Aldo/keto reductase [Acidimicrobiaceae bacterium]
MQTRRIGELDVTVVGLGCNNFGGRIDAAATDAVVGAALEEGINFFDTADVYGGARSEELLGRALGSRRDDVVVATKFGMAYGEHAGGAAPAYVRTAVERSLQRLGTDRIDLYQLHAPDADVPIAETLAALRDLVAQGKVLEIGCSNFTDAQIAEASRATPSGAPGFVSVQNEYSILHREPEDGVLEACDRLGMAFLPYFPLANGLLTGKYRAGEAAPEGTRLAGREREMTEDRMAKVGALSSLAADQGCTLVDLAFAWLLSRDVVASVIAGATSAAQVRANAATARLRLDADVLKRIDEIAPR